MRQTCNFLCCSERAVVVGKHTVGNRALVGYEPAPACRPCETAAPACKILHIPTVGRLIGHISIGRSSDIEVRVLHEHGHVDGVLIVVHCHFVNSVCEESVFRICQCSVDLGPYEILQLLSQCIVICKRVICFLDIVCELLFSCQCVETCQSVGTLNETCCQGSHTCSTYLRTLVQTCRFVYSQCSTHVLHDSGILVELGNGSLQFSICHQGINLGYLFGYEVNFINGCLQNIFVHGCLQCLVIVCTVELAVGKLLHLLPSQCRHRVVCITKCTVVAQS